MYNIQNYINIYLWWIIYSIIQGTIWIGLWVIGHECGHGAFAKSEFINDIFGLIIHSFLLVPYYAWQYSHKKHHKYTNHLIKGETHVPMNKSEYDKLYINNIIDIIGDDAFTLIKSIIILFFGWILYLFLNTTGGQIDYKGEILNKNKSISHFNTSSQLFPPKLKTKIIISNLFVCLYLLLIFSSDYFFGFGTSFKWYWGSYLITNCWLVLYTYLQHTSPLVPHYGNEDFTWLKGALSTIDRRYPFYIDYLHHHIGSTHVLHHLNYKIPFYYAKEATKELKSILGEKYIYDDTNIIKSYIYTNNKCKYVQSYKGIQYYMDK
jgi:omega-6 fatty acid desaturase (delta-12 desaturase)